MDDYIAERLTKSTAPRKDVAKIGRAASTAQTAMGTPVTQSQQPEAASGVEAAGTQAPPVDTDLAAQMREYQRKRRANKKAKEAAK